MNIIAQSKISKLVKGPKDTESPGALAQELAASKNERDNAVAAAEAKHEDVRGSVIQRGVERSIAIAQLREELAEEQAAIEAVVADAKK